MVTMKIVREWMEKNAINGGMVLWGSNERLEFPRALTVKDFEALALDIETKINTSNNDYAKCPSCNSDLEITGVKCLSCDYSDEHFA